jgi:glucose-6-phosphate isomerase
VSDPSHPRTLAAAAERLAAAGLAELLNDGARCARLQRDVGPLAVDLSRQRVDAAALALLEARAHALGLPAAIHALLGGEAVNASEGRAALHAALRDGALDTPVARAASAEARAVRTRMAALVARWHADPAIADVVHVGIGGSDLGPRLACEALTHLADGRFRLHFLPNVDAHALATLTRVLDPARTRVCLVSKSFGTQETLLNAAALRAWMEQAGGSADGRFVAITASPAKAAALGIVADDVLPLWDWVGGRYSLWSAVGLPVALSCGMDVFERLLAGARMLDQHYAHAPVADNLPATLALVDVWNRNALGLPTRAVVPYDDRLRLLPGFLQQLEMESNGKRVDRDGAPVAQATAPVVWGEVGTNAQHAFFQALHQGTDVVPVEFIGVARPDHDHSANHDALLANLLAQGAALAHGTNDTSLVPARVCPGGRPSTTILLDRLTPESLGALLAMYEHRVHAQGVMWGINSYDQWGVELGKRIADRLLPAVAGRAPLPDDADVATRWLLARITAARKD